MGHESPALRTIGNQLVIKQIRLYTADAVTADTFHLIECFHQINKTFARSLAEISDIHTSEHNFLATFSSSLPGLLHQGGNAGIATETTGKGNGAIGAEIITAILNLEEISRAIAFGTTGSKSLDVFGLLGVIAMQSTVTLATRPGLREKLYEIGLLVGTKHKIHSLNLAHGLWLQLGITTSHDHEGVRMLSHHTVYGLPAFVVGHLCHRTGVDYTKVCLFSICSSGHTHIVQQTPKSGCLRKIQLAPECKVGCFLSLKG